MNRFTLVFLLSILLAPVPSAAFPHPVDVSMIQKKEIMVYVTRCGKKYHKKDCKFLNGATPVAISLSEARKIWEPCEKCNPPK
jgi:hypothetical protein